MHPEDGEIIPPRPQVTREDVRAPREENRAPREESESSGSNVQDFGEVVFRQLPPGYTMGNYPVMGQPQNQSVFKPRMNALVRQ